MKNYKILIGIVLAGTLSINAQAGQNAHKNTRYEKNYSVSSRKAQSKVKVKTPIKRNVRSGKVAIGKKFAKSSKSYRQVSYRGVRYYVSNGTFYRPSRFGYVAVRKPW